MFFSLLRGELLHSSYRQMSISSKVSTLKHCPLVWVGPSKINCSNCFRRTSPDMVVSVCNGVSFLIIIITSSKKKNPKTSFSRCCLKGSLRYSYQVSSAGGALFTAHLGSSLRLSSGKFQAHTDKRYVCERVYIYMYIYRRIYNFLI